MSSGAKITPIGIGSMLITNNTTATLLPTQNAWVKIVAFDEMQQQRGALVVDLDDDDVTVNRRGVYELMAPLSFVDGSQKTYELAIAVNDVPQLKTRARTNFNSGNDTRFVVPYGILTLELGDTISIVARCVDAATQEVTVEDCTLSGKLLLLLPTL